MQRKIVFLHPLGPHSSPLTSQTLFGATCWAWATLGEDVGKHLGAFADGPRFAFSSTFPFVRRTADSPPVLLLPKPPLRPPIAIVNQLAGQGDAQHLIEGIDLAKHMQQARYVSSGVAAKLRAGEWNAAALIHEVYHRRVHLVQGMLLLPAEAQAVWSKNDQGKGKDKLWKRSIVQRNSVDRVAGATAEGLLFQQEQTFYYPGRAGLWAALWVDDILWPSVQSALRFIADTGLGGERAVGKGHFHLEIQEWGAHFPPSKDGAGRFMNLSEYIPESDETCPLAYELRHIRQKTESRYPGDSQRVYVGMMQAYQPGGVFETHGPGRELYGRLAKLAQLKDRSVYYSGVTIPLWGQWEV